jgi:hypothetical protein
MFEMLTFLDVYPSILFRRDSSIRMEAGISIFSKRHIPGKFFLSQLLYCLTLLLKMR